MKMIIDLIMNVDEKFSFQCNSLILVIYLDIILANQWIHEFNKFTKNLKVLIVLAVKYVMLTSVKCILIT
jgi:hypothetical protein